MRLAHLAGLRVLADRDGGVVDRPEVAHEARPGDAQLDLRRLPRPVELLGLQHLAHRVADRDQLADDADMLFRDAVGAAALAHLDRTGSPSMICIRPRALSKKKLPSRTCRPLGRSTIIDASAPTLQIDR
jgi:hypothetical protein